MKTIVKITVISVVVIFSFLQFGCEEEDAKTRSMDQIYAEEGVPVRIKELKKGDFDIKLSYNAVLSGIQESRVHAAFGDRVETINVNVGDYVKKDQILLTFPSDNPKANFFQAKVAFENAEKLLKRYENLYETGGISQQTLDNVRTQFEVDNANWDAVRQSVKVRAPISGYVTIVNVRETENVKEKQSLMTIAKIDRMKAKVYISEKDIDDVQTGNLAVAQWNGKNIEGKVTEVDLAMNPGSKSFIAKVEFPNQNNVLRSGVTAKIIIHSKSKNEIISVERKNLVKRGNEYFAFIADGNIAIERKVVVGKGRGLFLEIVDGVNENDLLITEGQMFLENESKIKIIK